MKKSEQAEGNKNNLIRVKTKLAQAVQQIIKQHKTNGDCQSEGSQVWVQPLNLPFLEGVITLIPIHTDLSPIRLRSHFSKP